MSRKPIAALAITLFVIAWIAAATLIGDYIRPHGWALQLAYYPLAGFLWVFPVRAIMLWSITRRAEERSDVRHTPQT